MAAAGQPREAHWRGLHHGPGHGPGAPGAVVHGLAAVLPAAAGGALPAASPEHGAHRFTGSTRTVSGLNVRAPCPAGWRVTVHRAASTARWRGRSSPSHTARA